MMNRPTGSSPEEVVVVMGRSEGMSRQAVVTASVDGAVVGRALIAKGEGVWEIYSVRVDPDFQGRGIASQLARFALADAEAAGVQVIPTCWYVDGFLRRHAVEFGHLRHSEPADSGGGISCQIAPSIVRPR